MRGASHGWGGSAIKGSTAIPLAHSAPSRKHKSLFSFHNRCRSFIHHHGTNNTHSHLLLLLPPLSFHLCHNRSFLFISFTTLPIQLHIRHGAGKRRIEVAIYSADYVEITVVGLAECLG